MNKLFIVDARVARLELMNILELGGNGGGASLRQKRVRLLEHAVISYQLVWGLEMED